MRRAPKRELFPRIGDELAIMPVKVEMSSTVPAPAHVVNKLAERIPGRPHDVAKHYKALFAGLGHMAQALPQDILEWVINCGYKANSGSELGDPDDMLAIFTEEVAERLGITATKRK